MRLNLFAALAVAAVVLSPLTRAHADDLANPAYADPHDAKSLTKYASRLIEDNKATTAIPFLLMAIEVDPGYSAAYMHLGNAYAEAGRDDKAAESYNRYLALSPTENTIEVQKRLAKITHPAEKNATEKPVQVKLVSTTVRDSKAAKAPVLTKAEVVEPK